LSPPRTRTPFASVAGAESGSSGLGPSRALAAAVIAVSFGAVPVVVAAKPAAAASRLAPVAGAEVGLNGLVPSHTLAAAVVVVSFVAMSVALCRAASPAQRAVAADAASSLFEFSSSVD
jgi:hypothetical protein